MPTEEKNITALVPFSENADYVNNNNSFEAVNPEINSFQKTSFLSELFNSRFKLYALYTTLFFSVTLFVFGIKAFYPNGRIAEASFSLCSLICSAYEQFTLTKVLIFALPELLAYTFVFIAGLSIFAPIMSLIVLLFSFTCNTFVYECIFAYGFERGNHLFVVLLTVLFSLVSILKILFCAEASKYSGVSSHGTKRAFRPVNFIPYSVCFLIFILSYLIFTGLIFLLFYLI